MCRDIICQPYHRDRCPSPSNQFNIFEGFQANYVVNAFIEGTTNYEKIIPLLNHIYVVWANKNDKFYHYILSWLAYPLRYLTKSKIVVMIKGKQGAGKSVIFDFMTRFIYGPHASLTVSGLDSVMGRFNGHLMGKLLVCVDETAIADKKQFIQDFDKFKNQITGSTLEIERKGQDKFVVKNICNYAITSNHNGIKVEQGDRRYFCIESSDIYVGNKDYFDNLIASCFNQECGDIFYTYLREGFELTPLNPIPITEFKQALIDDGTPKHIVFIDAVFTDESIPLPMELFHWDNKEKKFLFVHWRFQWE